MARSAIAKVAGQEPLRKLFVVLLTLMAVALGVLGQRQFVDEVNERGGLLFWAGAILSFLVALWLAHSLLRRTGEQPYEVSERPLSLRVEAGLVAVVLAVGIFFRFYRIEDIPPGLNNDAARNGLGALNLTPLVSFFTDPYVISGFGITGWGKESLFLQIIAVFQMFLGREAAVEVAAITAGIATLMAVYLLVRKLFDPSLLS